MVSVVVNNSEQQKKIECKKTPNIDTTMQDDIGIGGFLPVQYLIPIFVAWILFVCKCWLEKFVFFFKSQIWWGNSIFVWWLAHNLVFEWDCDWWYRIRWFFLNLNLNDKHFGRVECESYCQEIKIFVVALFFLRHQSMNKFVIFVFWILLISSAKRSTDKWLLNFFVLLF